MEGRMKIDTNTHSAVSIESSTHNSALYLESKNESAFKLFEVVFAQHLGVNIDEEHAHDLIMLAKDSLNVVPDGWEIVFSDSEFGDMPYYYDAHNKESSWTRPNEDYYRALITERRNFLCGLVSLEEDNPATSSVHKPQLINIGGICKTESLNDADIYINPQLAEFVLVNNIAAVNEQISVVDLQSSPISIFAQHLGVNNDETFAQHLAFLADCAASILPAGWEIDYLNAEYGPIACFYFDAADGSESFSQWEHPYEKELRALIGQRRVELNKRNNNTLLCPSIPGSIIDNSSISFNNNHVRNRVADAVHGTHDGDGAVVTSNDDDISICKSRATSAAAAIIRENGRRINPLYDNCSEDDVNVPLYLEPFFDTSTELACDIPLESRYLLLGANRKYSAEELLRIVTNSFCGDDYRSAISIDDILFAQQLGVLPDEEFHLELIYLCNQLLHILPHSWKVYSMDTEFGRVPFFGEDHSEISHWEHPYSAIFKAMVVERRRELASLCPPTPSDKIALVSMFSNDQTVSNQENATSNAMLLHTKNLCVASLYRNPNSPDTCVSTDYIHSPLLTTTNISYDDSSNSSTFPYKSPLIASVPPNTSVLNVVDEGTSIQSPSKRSVTYLKATRPVAALQAALNTDAALAILSQHEMQQQKQLLQENHQTHQQSPNESSKSTKMAPQTTLLSPVALCSLPGAAFNSPTTSNALAFLATLTASPSPSITHSNLHNEGDCNKSQGHNGARFSKLEVPASSGAILSSEEQHSSVSNPSLEDLESLLLRPSFIQEQQQQQPSSYSTSSVTSANNGKVTSSSASGAPRGSSSSAATSRTGSSNMSSRQHMANIAVSSAAKKSIHSAVASNAAAVSQHQHPSGLSSPTPGQMSKSSKQLPHPTLNSKIMEEYHKIQNQLQKNSNHNKNTLRQAGNHLISSQETEEDSAVDKSATTPISQPPSYNYIGLDDRLLDSIGRTSTVQSVPTSGYMHNQSDINRQRAIQRINLGSRLPGGALLSSSHSTSSAGQLNNSSSSRGIEGSSVGTVVMSSNVRGGVTGESTVVAEKAGRFPRIGHNSTSYIEQQQTYQTLFSQNTIALEETTAVGLRSNNVSSSVAVEISSNTRGVEGSSRGVDGSSRGIEGSSSRGVEGSSRGVDGSSSRGIEGSSSSNNSDAVHYRAMSAETSLLTDEYLKGSNFVRSDYHGQSVAGRSKLMKSLVQPSNVQRQQQQQTERSLSASLR